MGFTGGVATGLLNGPSAWELLIITIEGFIDEYLKRVGLEDDNDDDCEVGLVILMLGNAAVAADIFLDFQTLQCFGLDGACFVVTYHRFSEFQYVDKMWPSFLFMTWHTLSGFIHVYNHTVSILIFE